MEDLIKVVKDLTTDMVFIIVNQLPVPKDLYVNHFGHFETIVY